VATLVARLLATAPLGSNPDISQKYKMGDISKEVANILLPAKKNIQKTERCLQIPTRIINKKNYKRAKPYRNL
jgi:hypothetical protein